MHLRLSRSSTDGAQGDQAGEIFGADGVQQFAGDGQTFAGDVAEESSRDDETSLIWNGSLRSGSLINPFHPTWLLKIRSHDDYFQELDEITFSRFP